MTTNPTLIPVAIVGLGRAGWHLHFEPILKHQGFKIVAVADPDSERCQEAADRTGCRQFCSIDALLEETEANLVVVATPSVMHYSDIVNVLNSGRHCLAEKPMALNSREAEQIVALARQQNVKLFVHHAHLHLGDYHHLREVIESGILGLIFHIQGFWGNYARRWDWQTLKKNGGGQLNNTCPHILSVVLPLLGAPTRSVFADLRNIKDVGDAEDHVHLCLKAENGVTADITVSSALALAAPKWMLCGKYGTLTSSGGKSHLRYYDPAKAPSLSVIDAAAPDRKYLTETLPWEENDLEIQAPSVPNFHANVYDVLVHGAAQIVTPESAAEVVRVTELAHLAAAE